MMEQTSLSIEIQIESYLLQRNHLAIGLLYDKYAPLIYGTILRIVQDAQIADEVTQDAFVNVWENADKFDSTTDSLFSWVYQIARNAAIDRMKASATE